MLILCRTTTEPAAHIADSEPPSTPHPTSKAISSTLVGTLRRKNPFNRAPINTTDFAISSTSMKEEPVSPTVPPKSTLRPTSHILQRNKIDPTENDEEIEIVESNNRKSSKMATLSSKRLSLRIPNAFKNNNKDGESTVSKKFGFTLGANSRKQRKQLDLSLFQNEDQSRLTTQSDIVISHTNKSTITNASSVRTGPFKAESELLPPPILSDGSTLSSSSSTTSSTHSSYYSPVASKNQVPPTFKTIMGKQTPQNVHTNGPPRRGSQVSFKSMDRRGSNISTSTSTQHQNLNNRPTTPSLLSNTSTINSPTLATANNNSIPSQPAKASWLNNLFFFKQPKVCSLVVYSTHTAGILRSLHRLMNIVSFTSYIIYLAHTYSFHRQQKLDFTKSVIAQV